MKRFTVLASLITLFAVSACSDQTAVMAPDAPQFGVSPATQISVMSRNMYLGANIDPLIAPGADPAQVIPVALAQLQYTNYPARAQYLAMEIAARRPQLIGLQEVTRYRFMVPGPTGPVWQEIDFVQILISYLGAMGQNYDLAKRQNNVQLLLPGAGPILAVEYTDGDAILVRHDVPWADAAGDHFPTQVELTVGTTTFENKRGWVAVSAQLGGQWYRFVNTHLEIQAFKWVQEAQATELVAELEDVTLPTILVGDFNSAANANAPEESKTASYFTLRDAGFIDLWQQNSPGLTCCHAADLSNLTSKEEFDQRLDIVFVRNGQNRIYGRGTVEVFGQKVTDRFLTSDGYTLWPSDHAGVFGQISFAPGRSGK